MGKTRDGRGIPLHGTGYRLLTRIGAGTSSEVYEVEGPRGEIRALKVLREVHAGSREAVGRLLQEGRALAALDHPCIVRVVDAGVCADGRPFLVMPLLRGQTLRARFDRRGPLTARAAAAVVAQILDGLAAAHRAGIIHRDIKPANVFLTRGPGGGLERAVILDFGVAKVIGGALDPTTGAHVVGTPRYLSPEQILGGHVDARTDVYAVGLLLFEALAGRGPFPAADALEAMRAHLYAPVPRLRSLLPVPPALDRAVARAIAKRPSQRWQTAGAMAAALAPLLQDGAHAAEAS